MTIAEKFRRRCEEFPQNAANVAEFQTAIIEEVFAASMEFHMVDDDKTLYVFAFKDGSTMTVVNCKGLRFEILNAKELNAVRKARHFTKKELQDLALALESEREGRGPDNDPDAKIRGSAGHRADEPELEEI